MSGLSHTPGKRARGKTLRGFESRLLRQRPLARGFFRLKTVVPPIDKGRVRNYSPSEYPDSRW